MSDILVFAPPLPAEDPQSVENYKIGEVCGWLTEQGYSVDQRSLLSECRYRNRHRFHTDHIDLSRFTVQRTTPYLQGEQDEVLTQEAHKMADLLEIDRYDTVIAPLMGDKVISIRDAGLRFALPVLKERAADKITIIGGPNLSGELEVARLPFIDYVINGDMEIPLTNILNHEFNSEDLQTEPGVMTEKDGEIHHGHPYKHPMEDKAKPYYEEENLEKFAAASLRNIPIIPYKLGRGCTQNCSFCTYFEDQTYQYKSIDKVVRELRALTEELGTQYVRFEDQNLFNDPEYMKELALRFKKEGLDIKWSGLAIIIQREQEFFDTLAAGGCTALYHGIESASNTVLHRMNKHQTRTMIENTLKKEHNAGIKPFAGFITDYVDETSEEYFETIDFIKQNPHLLSAESTALSIFPSERQPLYRDPERFGIELLAPEEDDWMGVKHDFNVPYKDSRGKMGTAQDGPRRRKEEHLRRTAGIHLFLKNFGRQHPITFLRMQLRKLYMKDYQDVTHEYV